MELFLKAPSGGCMTMHLSKQNITKSTIKIKVNPNVGESQETMHTVKD